MTEIDYTADLSGSLRLSAEGEWYHNGTKFQNDKLARLFHRSIVWDDATQSYFLQIGRQRAVFDYDDTVFFVVALDESKNPCQITLADGSVQNFNSNSLKLGEKNQFYCTLENGMRARLLRGVHQHLSEKIGEDGILRLGDSEILLKAH